MAALTRDNQRDFFVGDLKDFLVAESTTIYKGSAVGDNGSGYARPLQSGDTFLGFAEYKVNNATGSAGDVSVRLRTRGQIKLAISGLVITDISKDVYASDDDTFTLTQGENTLIGNVARFLSAGHGIVDFKATAGFQSFDVVVGIGGQSNADGSGVLPASLDGENPAVMLFTKNNELIPCAEPAGRTGSNWINNIPDGNPVTPGLKYSCVTDLGKALLHLTGMRPLMVPCAIGSTAMENWSEPLVEDDLTTLFGAFTARVKDAQTKTQSTPPLIVWFGHEANGDDVTEDLSDGMFGLEYVVKWHTLVENLRERFPTSPIIFAQLATHQTGSLATEQRRGAESQRLTESTYGDSTTGIVKYSDPDLLQFADFIVKTTTENTDANNIITFNNGKMQLVSDGSGSPSPGAGIAILTPGKYYKVSVTATGTGTWRFFSDISQIGAANRPAGTAEIEFLAGEDISGTYPGFGRIRILRTAGATVNLEFTINSIEEAVRPAIDNTYMIVTHDLPRNINDGYHITTAGLREVGLRYAKSYAERVLGMHWINGTGPRLVSITKPSGTTVLVKFNKTIQADANDYGVNLATSLFRVYDDGSEATLVSVKRDGSDDTAVLITANATLSGVVVVTYGDRSGPNDGTWRAGVVKDSDDMPAPQFGPIVAV